MMQQQKVGAVIVTFQPEKERLIAALRAAASQVGEVIVVDNGGPASGVPRLIREQAMRACTLLSMHFNAGVAAAQNAGIARALSSGADYVLLLDDDSIPGDRMVERLLQAIGEAAARGAKVAAAGPRYIEERSGAESKFVRYGAFGAIRVKCADQDALVQTDVLIASGMLVAAAALRDVGLMDEALFIDHVDTDWCMRARGRGYSLVGACAATLLHRLGDKPSSSIAGRRIFFRSPDRHYYMFRNSILLYGRGHAPRRWVLGDAIKLFALSVAIAACCAPRAQHVAAMVSGVVHGFSRRTGPRPAR
jgi:rhamnosyltransferase